MDKPKVDIWMLKDYINLVWDKEYSVDFSEPTFCNLDLHFMEILDGKFILQSLPEECAANEEKQLLVKVAELLASSSRRKKILVQTAVDDLREYSASRTSKLQQEVSSMQDFNHTAKGEWNIHMEKIETHYSEDTASVESRKRALEEALQHWKGMEANQVIRSQLSSVATSSLEDLDVANMNLLCSIEDFLKLDNEARGNIDSMVDPCCNDLRDLKSGHCHKIVEITENAGTCLENEYMRTPLGVILLVMLAANITAIEYSSIQEAKNVTILQMKCVMCIACYAVRGAVGALWGGAGTPNL
ncbi:hypothetical protein GIB67_037867 [Kingdonia uniflora]|uniref:Uncharacterized protein n=1 Tax=Kingdonia uniflora TaxID=39325 RepID=A0A7J7LH79_9MAGN|nr:hypothetical protein GIB67_037867 [Kingdonia uniflora]